MKNTIKILQRIWLGLKIGWNTPNLPDNLMKLEVHPLIRILKVLGGISIFLVLTKKSILFPNFVIYFLLFFIIIFFIYHSYITYNRIIYIYKILKSEKLDVKPSKTDTNNN